MVPRRLSVALIAVCLSAAVGPWAAAQMRMLPRSVVDSVAARPRGWSADGLVFDSLTVHAPKVREDADPIRVSFSFVNKGRELFVIDRVESSCTCVKTGASTMAVLPGERCSIDVIYEQKGHPGRHDRSIYLYGRPSGDDGLAAVLTLSTDVIVSDDRSSDYPVEFGFFRLKTDRVSFICGRKAVERVAMINVSSEPRRLSFVQGLLPSGISVMVDKEVIAPGEETDIVISYDGGDSVHPSARGIPLKVSGTGLSGIQNDIYMIFN